MIASIIGRYRALRSIGWPALAAAEAAWHYRQH